jgi:hypothetical protein
MLLLIVLFGLFAVGPIYIGTGKMTFETGVATGFEYLPPNRTTRGGVAVSVRMGDGRTLQVLASDMELGGCAIGKPIELIRQRDVWGLSPFPCRPA